MITYNEFIDYLRDTELLDDIEIALVMFRIEEDYGSYLEALEANGYEEIDPDTYEDAMSNTYNDYSIDHFRGGNYQCGNRYYYIFDDYDEAEEAAKEYVKDIIDDIGYSSINGWEDYVDEDPFEDAMRESYESYAEDIESEGSRFYENRLVEECYDNGLIDDDDFELDEDGDPDYTQCTRDSYELQEMLADYLTNNSGYSSASQWYMDNFGDESFEYFVENNDAIDKDAIAEYCVDTDGVAHSLAGYDGEENEFEFEGTTYYIYRES